MSNSTSGGSNEYLDVCRLAASEDLIFANFKNETPYKSIVQTVGPHDGLRYYQSLGEDMRQNLQRFIINDVIGNPEKFLYEFGVFSPTTLRYAKVLDDLIEYGLEGARIAEIGVGFGGQYSVMRQILKPASYDFFDLEDVLPLVKRYVKALHLDDISLSYVSNPKTVSSLQDYDVVISNYAISECDEEIQNLYFENVIAKSKRGYITHNHQRGYPLQEFIQKLKDMGKNAIFVDEVPQTGSNNVVITW